MSQNIILVENLKDWQSGFADLPVVAAKDYLSAPEYSKLKNAHVINLCRGYRYLSTGYYSSLLAEARRHRAVPSVKTITDLSSKSIYSLNVEDLDDVLRKIKLNHPNGAQTDRFELDIYFGKCESSEMQDLSRQIFEIFRCPLLRVEFRKQGNWQINSIKPISIASIQSDKCNIFNDSLREYLGKRWRAPRAKSVARYDFAILQNPAEKMPPSNAAALKKFIKIGSKLGIDVELIEKKDFSRLAEYDALFIRETTAIDHYTYRFARKAEKEGMVVFDDPDSIMKCTNKVYLAELLASRNIPVPRTTILQKSQANPLDGIFEYPVVLKIPDGSFSRGIYKAESPASAKEILERLFRESDLILAQEFLYTDFDWRIGILNRKVLFACQYFMVKSHWQIVRHRPSGSPGEGAFKTWRIEDVPPEVIRIALGAANLIGDGFYGVDLKQNERGVYVIEVNDNPNLEAGVEDGVGGDDLYTTILSEFIRRIEMRKPM
jgi:glutathione synthase/RimK-type ligase-like ATP-grasp enzyme